MGQDWDDEARRFWLREKEEIWEKMRYSYDDWVILQRE